MIRSPRLRLIALVAVLGVTLALLHLGHTPTALAQTQATPSAVQATQTAEVSALQTVEAALTSEPTPVPSATPVPVAEGEGDGINPDDVVLIPAIESSHPHANSDRQEWIVASLDANAEATRLGFSRLELEDGVDWLIISDIYDVEIDRITGFFPNGVWSDPVPGNLAKITLVTDSSVQSWGFVLDKLVSVSYPTLAYSRHPYLGNSSQEWQFNNLDPNAEGTRIHFSRIELEDQVDWIVLLDVMGNPYQWITGSHPDGLWTNAVPGNLATLRLESDRYGESWGFNVDMIESAQPQQAEPRPTTGESLAESAHPYEADTSQQWVLVNPNPLAVNTKIHFSRLALPDTDDYVEIFDGSDNLVEQFSNLDVQDVWSREIPGRVVKLILRTDRYNHFWGFRVDQLVDGVNTQPLAQSAHPYAPSTYQTWTVVNPNPQAAFSKLYFDYLTISDSDDYLELRDGQDKLVQVFQNYSNGDFWSDDIPGRVIKINLITDRYDQFMGFRVNKLVDGERVASLAESEHPYAPNTEQSWTVLNPNPLATLSRVHFSRLDVSDRDDVIQIYDSGNNLIQEFRDVSGRDFWSDEVPGRVVKVVLRSDRYDQFWGFRIDGIAPTTDESPASAFVNAVTIHLGQPGNLYLGDTFVGRAFRPGDYRVTLPDVGTHTLTVDSLFSSQDIVLTTDEDGNVQIEYRSVETKP